MDPRSFKRDDCNINFIVKIIHVINVFLKIRKKINS